MYLGLEPTKGARMEIPRDLFADAREGPPSRSSFEALRCLLDVQPTEHMVDITRIRVHASHQGIILICTRQVVGRYLR